MTTTGVTIRIDFQNEEYDAVRSATRDDESVGVREGQAVKSSHIHQYVNNIVRDAIAEYETDDPLADSDVDVNELTEKQREALATELS